MKANILKGNEPFKNITALNFRVRNFSTYAHKCLLLWDLKRKLLFMTAESRIADNMSETESSNGYG